MKRHLLYGDPEQALKKLKVGSVVPSHHPIRPDCQLQSSSIWLGYRK